VCNGVFGLSKCDIINNLIIVPDGCGRPFNTIINAEIQVSCYCKVYFSTIFVHVGDHINVL